MFDRIIQYCLVYREPKPETCRLYEVLKRTSDSNSSEWPATTPRNHIGYMPPSVLDSALRGSIDFNVETKDAKYRVAEEIVRSQWAQPDVERELRHKAIDYYNIDKGARALGNCVASFQMKPTKTDRFHEELLQLPCEAWCSKIGCSPGFYSFRAPAMEYACYAIDWLNMTARRDYDAIIASNKTHKLKEPLRVHLPAPDSVGVVFWQKFTPPPGVYNFCPEALGNVQAKHFTPYRDLGGLMLGDLRHQQRQHILTFNKHFRHEVFLKPRVPRLSYPAGWPEKMRMSQDYFLVKNSLSIREAIMHFEAQDVDSKGICPLCVGLVPIGHSISDLTTHLMNKHGEYAVPGAKVVCFACGDEARVDEGPHSIFKHHSDFHANYEPFAHISTPTGIASRIKMASCALVVAATAIRVAATATHYKEVTLPAKVYNLGSTADSHIHIKNGADTVKIKSARTLGSQNIVFDARRIKTMANGLKITGRWADPAHKGQKAWTPLHTEDQVQPQSLDAAKIVDLSSTPPPIVPQPPATATPPPQSPPRQPSTPPPAAATTPPPQTPPEQQSPPLAAPVSPPPPGEDSDDESGRYGTCSPQDMSGDEQEPPAQEKMDELLNSDSDNIE